MPDCWEVGLLMRLGQIRSLLLPMAVFLASLHGARAGASGHLEDHAFASPPQRAGAGREARIELPAPVRAPAGPVATTWRQPLDEVRLREVVLHSAVAPRSGGYDRVRSAPWRGVATTLPDLVRGTWPAGLPGPFWQPRLPRGTAFPLKTHTVCGRTRARAPCLWMSNDALDRAGIDSIAVA